jgi:hypothetical protein
MLYQSDYWLATNFAEKIETVLQFLDTDEHIKTLMIIDKNPLSDAKDVFEYLDEKNELKYKINLIIGTYTCSYGNSNQEKTIYISYNLNEETIRLMKDIQPILAIFI